MKAGTRDSGGWSLSGRLTRWIALGTGALLLLGIGFGAWFMLDALKRELDALVVEEIAELTVDCQRQPIDPALFEEITRELDREHPGFHMLFRAWRPGDEAPWAESEPSGRARRLLASKLVGNEQSIMDPLLRQETITFPVRLRGADDLPIETTLRVEMLMDGTPRAEEMLSLASVLLVLILLGATVTVLGGAYFARRFGGLMRQVALSAESARLDEDAEITTSGNAPDEIRQVVDAFRDGVAQMRAEHSRNVLLTAGLAHELRSPLQLMISEAEVTLLSDREVGEYRQTLERQLEDLREFALTVDNLITLTALRDTRGLARGEDFDFAAESELRLGKEETEASKRGVVLVLRHLGDTSITGDREALILMLRNLVDNAIRWTAADSRVTVTLDGRAGDLLVSVEDEGRGVRPEERELIFEPFRQGAAPAGLRTGYGLGLALARAAARSQHGEIRVESGSRGGARFEVRLPRRNSA